MQVMGIGHVGMGMVCRLVAMHVAVLADRHRIVRVPVMPVIVPMGVLMVQRLVLVFVAV